MSLEAWLANRWLSPHAPDPREIKELLDAAAPRLSTAALQAAGYRASRDQKHYRTIAALPFILGPAAQELTEFLDRCRTKRHDVTYESLSSISNPEADELIEAVVELDQRLRNWLRRNMPTASEG